MTPITLVTGNPHKLRELQAMAPADLPLRHQALELEEIQSLDLREIITHKVRQAFDTLGAPVIVEDVAAGLDELDGLPGPFIKFFNQTLGGDSLHKLAKSTEPRATVLCLTAYFDGTNMYIGEGTLHCQVVAPRGAAGFGFDVCLIPDGQTCTMAELDPAVKNRISHRALAFQDLLRQIAPPAP